MAFDTVKHDIILSKLDYYGVRDVPLKWFKSYLQNRQQCVKINSNIFDFQTILCGVPQGSVLGPLLFLTYINDICLSAPKVSFHLFADDTRVFYSNKSPKQLENVMNNALGNIGNWLKTNKLTLNVKKSNLILFNIKKNPKLISGTNRIYIGSDQLEHKETAKYLGVYFDKKLSWNKHIQYTNSKISRSLGILSKVRNYVQEKNI